MCGIAGIVDARPRPEGEIRHAVSAMTRALAHRGPDGEGIWSAEGVALGHRRLSILDLSDAGAQPMHSDCGRFTIVFNGEIYNHLEIRRDLEKAGIAPAWRGHSDTETLLAGFVSWGVEQTLQRAIGMFAIALWDRQKRRLSLSRDRMGEKPLYWGWAGSSFVFGSELKALRQHSGFPHGICRDALALYLRFAYVPAPRSIHAGVFKLEPGCILEVEGNPPPAPPGTPLRPGDRFGTISIKRYWSLDDVIEAGARSLITDEAEAVGRLEAALKVAVDRQRLSDVPLGAFLSGGIDSSLIVSLMQEQSREKVRTFTIGFENPSFNEAPYAAAVASHLGTDHTELVVTENDAMNVIPRLPQLYDEPFADPSQIPTHLVSEVARRHVTVALSGDAGDELFGGYNRYAWAPRVWNRLKWMPGFLPEALGSAISAVPSSAWEHVSKLAHGRSAISRAGDKAQKLAESIRSVRSLDDLYLNLVSQWRGGELVIGLEREPPSQLADPLPASAQADPVLRMIVQDMRTYLPDDILCKVDRAAMSVSLETRVPFLDRDIVAISAQIPMSMKIRDGKGKWVLRQILNRYVPNALIERPKTGFGIPLGEWLRGPLKPWADDLLDSAEFARSGLMNAAPIRQAWLEHQSGRRDWTTRLWTVLMFQAWLRTAGGQP